MWTEKDVFPTYLDNWVKNILDTADSKEHNRERLRRNETTLYYLFSSKRYKY